MVPIIDSHHHLWRYSLEDYGWIDEEMKAIRRDFLPDDLQAEIAAAGVDGVISVQSRQSLDETRWLLELARRHTFIRGVVGWAPLMDPEVEGVLEQLTTDRKLKAVRHVIQGEADDFFILRPDFNRGVAVLERFGLAYDILIYERHLPQTIQFVDRHPGQSFVLDHIAKPRIRAGELSPWRENIRELARRENVCCKVSGLVTEADYRSWTVEQLRPYVETVLEAFGPGRLLFGSDWPVCLAACTYRRWFEIVSDFAAELSPSEREAILGDNAAAVYRLEAA